MVTGLGTDSWANDCRMKVREGLRSNNLWDFGGARVWLLDNQVILTDENNENATTIAFGTKSAALAEAVRICDELCLGATLIEAVRVDIPEKLMNALIS